MKINLLIPFDGSPAAAAALDMLVGYAGDPAALRPVLLYVQSQSPGSGDDVLAMAAKRLAERGIVTRHEIRKAVPAPAILSEAKKQRADAIIMGTRGAGPVQGYALGSVALRVAHRARIPVFLVKPHDALPVALGKRLKVILAMDGSEPAVRAAERLAAWRGWLGELDVQLVWVQQPLTYLEAVLPPHDDVIEQWSTKPGEQAANAARELFKREGIAHHLHLTTGEPAEELRLLAEETCAELVVLGTRGLGALHHAFIGSVSLKAVALSPVPVLLVP